MRILTLTFLIINSLFSYAQGWDVNYGFLENSGEDAKNAQLINDSLYIFHSVSLGFPYSDLGVSKLNLSSGELDWTKVIGDTTFKRTPHYTGKSDVNSSGNRFVTACSRDILSGDSLLYFAEIVMYDEHLDTLFTRVVGDTINAHSFNSVKFLSDGGFVAVGEKRVPHPSLYNTDLIIYRYNAQGEEQWNNSYRAYSNSRNSGLSVLELSDGKILVGAHFKPSGPGSTDPKLLRYSSDGQLLNDGILYVSTDDSYYGAPQITSISEEEVLINLHKSVDGITFFRVIKLTHNLIPVFDRTYSTDTYEGSIYYVTSTHDGGFITSGIYNSTEIDPYVQYARLTKFNAEGDYEWERKFNSADTTALFNLNEFNHILELPPSMDGGYIVCGSVQHNNELGSNFLAMRLDKDGCLTLGCFDKEDRYVPEFSPAEIGGLNFIIFPNPTSDVLNVFIPDQFTIDEQRSLRLEINDYQGRLIHTAFPEEGNSVFSISVEHLSEAPYVISLYQGADRIASEKFVKSASD